VPTYEYACSSCDRQHEVVQKMTDPTLTVCPDCGEPTLRKLFSGVGIHFKGSGFYRTDSRDAKSSTAPKAPAKESAGSSSGGSSSSSGSSTDSGSSSSSSSSSGSGSGSSSSSSGSNSTPAASTS
jgi:putative FmdB family regulatory protein